MQGVSLRHALEDQRFAFEWDRLGHATFGCRSSFDSGRNLGWERLHQATRLFDASCANRLFFQVEMKPWDESIVDSVGKMDYDDMILKCKG